MSLSFCQNGHEPIAHDLDRCPLCRALLENHDLELRLDRALAIEKREREEV